MLSNRVRETSTTTGTGNFTLAGAETDLRTFTSQYATNIRFPYFIVGVSGEFENGVGYLSGTTTLVRDIVADSSNSGALVNFSSGDKSVFVSPGAEQSMGAWPLEVADIAASGVDGLIQSPHYGHENTNKTLVADRVHYMPFLATISDVTRIAISSSTSVGTATQMRVGICLMDQETALPDPTVIIAETSDITPTSNTAHISTVTAFKMQCGVWYCAIVLSDGNNQIKATGNSSGVQQGTPFGNNNATTAVPITYFTENISSGWSTLPTTLGTLSQQNNDFAMRILVGA